MEISRGREPLHGLQHGKVLKGNVSLPNVMPVLILRRYILIVLVLAKMEAEVKFLGILQAEFEPAYNHSGALLGRVFSQRAKSA